MLHCIEEMVTSHRNSHGSMGPVVVGDVGDISRLSSQDHVQNEVLGWGSDANNAKFILYHCIYIIYCDIYSFRSKSVTGHGWTW